MPEKWTGILVGKMHNNNVTIEDMALELGVTKSYVSMVLNSKRKPKGIQKRMEAAFNNVVLKREATLMHER